MNHREPSPEEREFDDWIRTLSPAERAEAERRGVAEFEAPSFHGRTVETWQMANITEPDDDDFDLKLDLLDAGAPPELLDDLCEAVEIHTERVAWRLAAVALHQAVAPLLTSRSPKLHGLLHAIGLSNLTLEQSAAICGVSRNSRDASKRRRCSTRSSSPNATTKKPPGREPNGGKTIQ